MPDRYLKLNDIECYKISFHLSNYVWNIVVKWEWFPKKTVSAQFVDAVDSIQQISQKVLAGISKWTKLNFIVIVKESFDWNEKSKVESWLATMSTIIFFRNWIASEIN